jgi:hypothetical protein
MGMPAKIGKKIRFFDANQRDFCPIAREIAWERGGGIDPSRDVTGA